MLTTGVDIGGTNLRAGVVDASGRVLERRSCPTPDDLESLLAAIVTLLEALDGRGRFERVGLGIPGLRSRSGRMESSPNMPFLNGVNLEARLSEQIRKPVVGRNDAEMHTWGEYRVGAGAGSMDMVGLTLGTGIGSGLVVRGQLYSGSRGYAPEAGHLIVQENGLPCACGSRGCVETVASATGIVELARRRFSEPPAEPPPDPPTARRIHELAGGGHARAIEVFQSAGRYLGIACADLINLLNPEVVVIGGGVAAAGRFLFDPVIAEARARAFAPSFESSRIVPALLGDDAGVVGAALLAREGG